ncbi:MAG: AMP-binding protein [Solirubrobacteraceae bacterium]
MSVLAWEAHLPAGVRADDLDLTAKGSLSSAWVGVWASAPSAPTLFDRDRGWIHAEHLEDATRRVAGRLQGAGLEPGDRMLFSAESSLELVIAHVAALRSGIVVVPANTAYREREVAHIVTDARPKAALVDDPDRARWIRAAAGPETVVVGPDVDLPDHEPAVLDATALDEPALIGYTSGTTGSPKGAVLTHANLLAGSESVGLAWRWTASDRLVLALPLFHVHGLCVGLHGTLLAGASAVLLARFDVDSVLDAAGSHDASLFFGVPTMYHRLAHSARVGELARLRLCVSGSAPLPAELHRALAERGGQQVLERYGMTETLMNVSNPYDGERRAGSVGLPLPGVELRLSNGQDGEIQLRGPNIFAGYWERPQATAESFDDGWFCTGDLGGLDPDGYLRILGRSKELIISGGFNVYPREVEEVLLAHPAVAEVAVVGAPSDEWGEVVAAFVVPTGNTPTAESLLTFAAEQLAPFKRPRLIHFVDTLPRNALGKVLKHELAG